MQQKEEILKSKKKWVWFFLILIVIIILNSLTHPKSSGGTRNVDEQSILGTYSYSDNSLDCTITIYGSSWNGKIIAKSGFGSEYDNQNAQIENGIVKDNDLYESSGTVKIGFVHGNSLTTTMGGQQLTLSK